MTKDEFDLALERFAKTDHVIAEPKITICPKCNGSGFVPKFNDGLLFAEPCECRERMLAENRLKASGISEAFHQKTFEGFNTKGVEILETAKSKAIDYATRFKELEKTTTNSAMFIGQVGSGKTHLSLAIANDLLRQGVGVFYMSYRETMMTLKQLAMTDKEQYEKELYKYKTARVLIIDDLYKGTNTDADINYVFQIINHRYMNGLPFVCSSEKDVRELIEIDEAIASRMIEQAKGHSVLIKGKELNYRIR